MDLRKSLSRQPAGVLRVPILSDNGFDGRLLRPPVALPADFSSAS